MSLQQVRNIGIAAHIDAGKTTTTERILYFTGTTRKMGEVHDGQATMDFMKQEQERGITIASAAITCNWRDHVINIIDTPGHIDFTVEVERSLRVLDGMIAVFCAVGGVEPQSETVWKQADNYNVPRVAFVNKMDRPGADLDTCIKQMDDILDAKPVKFQLPIGSSETFVGIIDLITMRAFIFDGDEMKEEDIPSDLLEKAEEDRHTLVEKLADFDDELMEKFLNEEEISVELIRKVARKSILKLFITPVFCGSAFTNKGIRPILDAIVDYLPNPIDAGVAKGVDFKDQEKILKRDPSPHEPFSALAFKIIHDPFVGQQTFIRIYSGEVKTGDTVLNVTKQKRERIGRILRIKAKDRIDLEKAVAGDIVALIGTKYTTTGNSLSKERDPILFEAIRVPASVVSAKIITESRSNDEKLGIALNKLALEDPSFSVRFDSESDEVIISGMGELHLEVLISRLKEEFKVGATLGAPSVVYKETITMEAEANKKYAKQSGGKGQYGHCVLRIEPNEAQGFEFIDKIKGGRIPQEYIPSVKKGIVETMQKGILADYSVVDVKVTLLDGSYHEVDSSEMAFKIAGSLCFKEAFSKAKPVLLEPIMKIEINSPDDYLGDIIGDLNRRRGKVSDMRRFRKGSQKIVGTVPLREMFGYANTLRTISSGRANYSMEFLNYQPLPRNLAEEVFEDARKKREEK